MKNLNGKILYFPIAKNRVSSICLQPWICFITAWPGAVLTGLSLYSFNRSWHSIWGRQKPPCVEIALNSPSATPPTCVKISLMFRKNHYLPRNISPPSTHGSHLNLANTSVLQTKPSLCTSSCFDARIYSTQTNKPQLRRNKEEKKKIPAEPQ